MRVLNVKKTLNLTLLNMGKSSYRVSILGVVYERSPSPGSVAVDIKSVDGVKAGWPIPLGNYFPFFVYMKLKRIFKIVFY